MWYYCALILIGAETMKLFHSAGNLHFNKVLKTSALPNIALSALLLATILILPSFASAEIYPSGRLKSKGSHGKGIEEGIYKEYYESGKLKSEVNYIDGKEEGLKRYYYESGELHQKIKYKNGKVEGLQKLYYKSGQLRVEVSIKNNKLDGLAKYYFESGELEEKTNYKNGKLKGISMHYFKNGNIRGEVEKKDKHLIANIYSYYESGELQEVKTTDTKWDGFLKQYYKNGNLSLEQTIRNDKKNGVSRSYYESGDLKFRDIFKNGRKIHRTAYDERGKRTFSQDYPYDIAEAKVPSTSKPSVSDQTPKDLFKEEKQQIRSIATGFIFSSSGYILTNYHIVQGAKTIKVKYHNGEKVTAEVIIKDSQNDIAFLKPQRIPKIKPINLSLGDSSSVRLGDKVFTLGYPIANVLGESLKYSEGVINSLSGVGNDPKTFQISIPTQSGNSGGPLFNKQGEVIGIVSSSLDEARTQQVMGITPQNVNFAIKSSLVRNMLAMLPENLISPTDLSLVQNKSQGSTSNFIQRVENNIVLIQVE